MLYKLDIEKNFFQKISLKENKLIAEDLDLRFNLIADYLNNEVYSELLNVVVQTKLGTNEVLNNVDNPINTYLFCTEEGNFTWKRIEQSDIPDNSIDVDKLLKYKPCTLLLSDSEGVILPLKPGIENELIVLQDNEKPDWSTINHKNIKDGQITESKVALGTLTEDNFLPEALCIFQPQESQVDGSKLRKDILSSRHLKDGEIDFSHLVQDVKKSLIGEQEIGVFLWGSILNDNIVDEIEHLAHTESNIPAINHSKITKNFIINDNLYLKTATPFNEENFVKNCILSEHIKDNSLDGDRLNVNFKMLQNVITLDNLQLTTQK